MIGLDESKGFRMLRGLLSHFRLKRSLARERDTLAHEVERLRDDRALLLEQLQIYRDTLASFQAEQNLRGAIAASDLAVLSKR